MTSNEKDRLEESWFKSFSLFITIIKTMLFLICATLLYITFGDSIDFNFQKSNIHKRTFANSPSGDDTEDWDKVENGIHVASGLVYTDNFDIIRANCTACHSGKLVAQNRATREGWEQMIRWMQQTQGLWDLGKNEPIILDYLAKYYAPKEVGRRANIDIAKVEWYILELDKE